jgi:quercetin dioxygenase-like cupin family protein
MKSKIYRILVLPSVLSLVTISTVMAHELGMKVGREIMAAEVLENVPGHKLTAVRVNIAPGVVTPSHRHAGFVFIYVLEGTVESQLNNGEIVSYKAGESWVEPPGTLHSHAKNPSKTDSALILAIFIAEDGAQLTTMENSSH